MVKEDQLLEKHLTILCEEISNRGVGSKGNIEATTYFETQLINCNWSVETQEFKVFDWVAE